MSKLILQYCSPGQPDTIRSAAERIAFYNQIGYGVPYVPRLFPVPMDLPNKEAVVEAFIPQMQRDLHAWYRVHGPIETAIFDGHGNSQAFGLCEYAYKTEQAKTPPEIIKLDARSFLRSIEPLDDVQTYFSKTARILFTGCRMGLIDDTETCFARDVAMDAGVTVDAYTSIVPHESPISIDEEFRLTLGGRSTPNRVGRHANTYGELHRREDELYVVVFRFDGDGVNIFAVQEPETKLGNIATLDEDLEHCLTQDVTTRRTRFHNAGFRLEYVAPITSFITTVRYHPDGSSTQP